MDATEEHASGSLRSVLWKLKRMNVQMVETCGELLTLDDGVEVDVRQSEEQARRLIGNGCPCLESDYELEGLRGDLLPEWDEHWLMLEREHQRQLRLHAMESLCERLVAAGRVARAVEAGLAAVQAEPLRESAHRALIRAYLAEGNACEAVRQFCTCRDLLERELAVAPSALLTAIMDGVTER